MVQTFGKRVLGGIGAPGGGMSTAYAEGVNVGINQRANRQAMVAADQEMRMREQDQQFKIEDREEAKRQRAAAAANAAAATNATNKLDADKINASLALTANQFNTAEKNKIAVVNANAANELVKFNAEQTNQRENFNATMTAQINIANAKTLADVSTANTAATNAANAVNAKNATDMSASVYAQQNLIYKDLLEMSWKSGEQEQDRIVEIAKATISANASMTSAGKAADAASSSAVGSFIAKAALGWLTGITIT